MGVITKEYRGLKVILVEVYYETPLGFVPPGGSRPVIFALANSQRNNELNRFLQASRDIPIGACARDFTIDF